MRRFALLLALAVLPGLPAAAQQHDGHAGGHDGHVAVSPTRTPWTSLPIITQAGRGRSAMKVRIQGVATETLSIHPPAGEPWTAPASGGMAEVVMKEDGNYHWLVAREQTASEVSVASAEVYFPAPGPAPSDMLGKQKTELEVVPDPLPREHGHYRAREEWAFKVRFHGEPLSGTTLHLQTRNGTHQSLVTDRQGVAKVVFPDDFAPGAAEQRDHHARPPSADFVLWTQHYENNVRFLTAFNDTYQPQALATKAVWPGAMFLGVGMLAAVPLLRRGKMEGRA